MLDQFRHDKRVTAILKLYSSFKGLVRISGFDLDIYINIFFYTYSLNFFLFTSYTKSHMWLVI